MRLLCVLRKLSVVVRGPRQNFLELLEYVLCLVLLLCRACSTAGDVTAPSRTPTKRTWAALLRALARTPRPGLRPTMGAGSAIITRPCPRTTLPRPTSVALLRSSIPSCWAALSFAMTMTMA